MVQHENGVCAKPPADEYLRWCSRQLLRKKVRPPRGIPEYVGGIPGHVFVAGERGWEKGKSGHWFCYEAARSKLVIADGPRTDLVMQIALIKQGNINVAQFYLKTRNHLNERHADMRAREFFGSAITYLAHYNGRVDEIRGYWQSGDNLAAFQDAKAKGYSDEEAALKTWTGRQAAANGYGEVLDVIPRPRLVQAAFGPSKP